MKAVPSPSRRDSSTWDEMEKLSENSADLRSRGFSTNADDSRLLDIDFTEVKNLSLAGLENLTAEFSLYKNMLFLEGCHVADSFFLFKKNSAELDMHLPEEKRTGSIPYYLRIRCGQKGISAPWALISYTRRKNKETVMKTSAYLKLNQDGISYRKSLFNAAKPPVKDFINNTVEAKLTLLREQTRILEEIGIKLERLKRLQEAL